MTAHPCMLAALYTVALGLTSQAMASEPNPNLRGQAVFAARCAVCHGVNADGKSGLAEVMSVKPANLRTSVLSSDARRLIVMQGGGALGRSDNMPAWQAELNAEDLAAVIEFASSVASDSKVARKSH